MKKSFRLRDRKIFQYVYHRGKSASCRAVVLVYARGEKEAIRVGFSVSKKVGNSVVRNRVKRRLKEAIRPLLPDMKTGVYLVFIARQPIVLSAFADIQKDVRTLLKKANLFKNEAPP